MKTLRLLQYFPAPADASVLGSLNDLLRKIIRGDTAASQSHRGTLSIVGRFAYPGNRPLWARGRQPNAKYVKDGSHPTPKPSLCGRPGYEPVKNLDKNNAQQAIVLEAVALALALDSAAEGGHQGSVLGHRGTLSRQG